jgi:hypothetical protein
MTKKCDDKWKNCPKNLGTVTLSLQRPTGPEKNHFEMETFALEE